jgi:hypothetical protein
MMAKLLDNSAEVDAYMSTLEHPGKDVVGFVRAAILAVDHRITEGIKWNAPCFHYKGDMAVFNLHPKSPARMVFIKGAAVDEGDGLFAQQFADGRRLIIFKDIEDAAAKIGRLEQAVRRWIVWSDNQEGGKSK